MATVIVDTEGKQVSEDFGVTEFCSMVQSCEKGKACCMSTWKSDLKGIYECPFGFLDFSIPIVLPDGQVLGKVLAGQALSDQQDVEEIVKKTADLEIDEKTIREVLARTCRKTENEMQGVYDLLNETLHFFIENSYSVWKTEDELKKAPAKKDRVLSQITQIMYSYNLTIDLETEAYTLITGTGMERTVAEYKKHEYKWELEKFHNSIIHPAYVNRFNELLNFESARHNPSENGYKGSMEYPVLYPGEDEYEWHEINVFIDTEEDGTMVANILGRNITKSHNAQESCFKGKRILMTEDNELNAEIAITILEEAGFEVDLATDGIICVDMLEKADAGYYDLILMDIQMPNMNGYKATKTIRNFADKEKEEITIVAMTANAFEEDKKDAYKAGMNWHISKPIRIEELMSALADILKAK